jgi:hypothetical protein
MLLALPFRLACSTRVDLWQSGQNFRDHLDRWCDLSLMKLPVNLDGPVQEVLRELLPAAERRERPWRTALLPQVTGGHAMRRLVFVDLSSNVLRFTRPRERTEVDIGALLDEGQGTVFYARDHGVGSDMRYADKLFGVFQRPHRVEDFEGTDNIDCGASQAFGFRQLAANAQFDPADQSGGPAEGAGGRRQPPEKASRRFVTQQRDHQGSANRRRPGQPREPQPREAGLRFLGLAYLRGW